MICLYHPECRAYWRKKGWPIPPEREHRSLKITIENLSDIQKEVIQIIKSA